MKLRAPRQLLIVTGLVALITVGFWLSTQPTSSVNAATFLQGTPIPKLSPLETSMFNTGFQPFNKVWDPIQGLGPVFTNFQCPLCHSDPGGVAGGNSIQKVTFVGKINTDGSYNDLSSEGGPQIQPMSNQQFKSQCNLLGEVAPPDATIVASHQSPQLFGLGLIDNIADSDIMANAVDKGMGIHGVPNMIEDENHVLRVGRFGLKSQAATLRQMTANAELHELGVTNPIFPNEDLPQGGPIPPFCSVNRQPNDDGTQAIDMYHYLLYLAPHTPGTGNANGQALFSSIGCALCHVPSYTTTPTVMVQVDIGGRIITSKALASQPVNLYSDLLLHDLGGPNGDGLQEGLATATQFRTAPLWGLSTRLSSGDGLLHDGRVKTISAAINQHGGEAAQVVAAFKALSAQNQHDLIAFLNSL
jgi:hypothetical protein